MVISILYCGSFVGCLTSHSYQFDQNIFLKIIIKKMIFIRGIVVSLALPITTNCVLAFSLKGHIYYNSQPQLSFPFQSFSHSFLFLNGYALFSSMLFSYCCQLESSIQTILILFTTFAMCARVCLYIYHQWQPKRSFFIINIRVSCWKYWVGVS